MLINKNCRKANNAAKAATEFTNASNKKQVNNRPSTKAKMAQRIEALEEALDNIWLKTTDEVTKISGILKKGTSLTPKDIQYIENLLGNLKGAVDKETDILVAS